MKSSHLALYCLTISSAFTYEIDGKYSLAGISGTNVVVSNEGINYIAGTDCLNKLMTGSADPAIIYDKLNLTITWSQNGSSGKIDFEPIKHIQINNGNACIVGNRGDVIYWYGYIGEKKTQPIIGKYGNPIIYSYIFSPEVNKTINVTSHGDIFYAFPDGATKRAPIDFPASVGELISAERLADKFIFGTDSGAIICYDDKMQKFTISESFGMGSVDLLTCDDENIKMFTSPSLSVSNVNGSPKIAKIGDRLTADIVIDNQMKISIKSKISDNKNDRPYVKACGNSFAIFITGNKLFYKK